MDLIEGRQELQKPSCGFCNKRFTSARILQNHMESTHFSSASSDERESSNQRDLSKRYSLRENPRKTRNSPESNLPEKHLLDHSGAKNNLICKECGMGFRYEKGLLKHHIGLHMGKQRTSEESTTGSSSFSLARKQRSRIIRYKKTRISSFSTYSGSFSVSETEQEVAESPILLSRSSGNCLDGLKLVDEFMDSNLDHDGQSSLGCLSSKKMRKAGEFGYGFLSDKQKQLGEGISVEEMLKDLSSDLGFMNTHGGNDLDYRFVHDHEQRSLRSGDYAEEAALKRTSSLDESRNTLCDAEAENEPGSEVAGSVSCKPGCNEAEYEASSLGITDPSPFDSCGYNVSEAKPTSTTHLASAKSSEFKRSSEHQFRTCDKVFLSCQALEGSQTPHRTRNKGACRAEAKKCSEKDELEGVNDSIEHKCIVCSRVFRSAHALGVTRSVMGLRNPQKPEMSRP